jgi:hypothetical protein
MMAEDDPYGIITAQLNAGLENVSGDELPPVEPSVF